jgi:hypothetical protein
LGKIFSRKTRGTAREQRHFAGAFGGDDPQRDFYRDWLEETVPELNTKEDYIICAFVREERQKACESCRDIAFATSPITASRKSSSAFVLAGFLKMCLETGANRKELVQRSLKPREERCLSLGEDSCQQWCGAEHHGFMQTRRDKRLWYWLQAAARGIRSRY